MSSEVKWIKIVTDIFDDEKILLIESMPDADAIIVIWFKLLCLAGKQNNDGVLIMNNRIPYNDEMLAHIFRRPLNTVRLALKTFEQYGMIEIVNNTITIPNWSKHQQLDSLEKKRERQREWVAEKREKQRLIANSGNLSTSTSVDMSTPVDALERDKERDIERDIHTTYVCSEIVPISEPPAFRIILNDKSYFDVTQKMVDDYQNLYPAVDVPQEIRKMVGWSEANPKKRKTKRGVKAFMNSWLAREQDRGPRKAAGTQTARPSFSELAKGDNE